MVSLETSLPIVLVGLKTEVSVNLTSKKESNSLAKKSRGEEKIQSSETVTTEKSGACQEDPKKV